MGIGVENRWDRRLSVDIPVELHQSLVRARRARLRDVSGGGVFVVTDAPLRQGSVVDVRVPLPGRAWAGVLRFRALVIWVDGRGAGLMFCQDDDITYRLLTGYAHAAVPASTARTPSGVEC